MKIIVDNLIFEALKPSEFRRYMNVGRDLAMKRIGQIWSKLQAESIGSNRNGDRLYFNITEKVDFFDLKEIPISVEINDFFKENGFEIVDVRNNKAKNLKDGRIVSIMKILESLRKVNPELVAYYIKQYDEQRSLMLDKKEKIMVISKSAYDIAGMSTDRKWGSCMDIRGKHENIIYVPLEIETGTLVSYLVNPSDKNINKPYARVLIKPYLNRKDETDVLYGIEHDIVRYGKRDPEYIKTLINLLDKAQGEKIGIFELNPTSYLDFGKQIEIRTPIFNDYKKMSIEDIEKVLNFLKIKNYKINDDNSIDVDGDVYISGLGELGLKKIPIQFNRVSGRFSCSSNQLKSLEGAPREVGGTFSCDNNKLKSLEGAPTKVGGHFDCSINKLKSLEGAPTEIRGHFDCSINKLKSLEGSPIGVKGNFKCNNNQLETLKGAPREVGGHFFCYSNELESLEGAPTEVRGRFNCSENKLKSLEGGPKEVWGYFYCYKNLLESLEGAPRKVGGDFNCANNPKKFTEEDVKAVSDVDGEIFV